MTDELDAQNDPADSEPTPRPDESQDAAPQVSPVTAAPSAAPGPIPPLGAETIAEVFSDMAALPSEAPEQPADPLGIKEPSMDFTATMPPAEDPMIVHPAEFPQLMGSPAPRPPSNIDLLLDVKLPVSIELGRTVLPISDILNWAQGTIVELDKLAGEPVSLLVNNKLVARGEVVVVDENFGLRITSLVSPRERVESL
jgi:flagellar motor switch protein FliN/FliY